MAKQRRELAWGEGYISDVTQKSGRVAAQARWREPDPIRGSVLKSRNFGTREEAAEHLRRIAQQRHSGTYEAESTITVSEAVSDYCEARLAQRKWTPNTYQTNKIFQRKMIDPSIGKARVTRLRPKQLQDWVDQLVDQKAVSTVSSTLSIVRGALRRMAILGIIDQNPADPVEVKAREQQNVQVWTLEEAQAIIAGSRCDPAMHVFYLLGFNSGMRPGEMRALRWSDVDWETGAITVARSITKDEHGKEVMGNTTKNKKTRVVVVGGSVIAMLKNLKAEQNTRRLLHVDWKDTIIFDRGDGWFMPGTTLISRHNRILAPLDVPKYPPKSIRHTDATLEDEIGATPGVTKARFGHATEMFTINRYTHAQISAQKTVAERLARLLLGDTADTTTSEENRA